MTTQELKERKKNLENLIQQMVSDFSKETGFIPVIQNTIVTSDTFCGPVSGVKINISLQ